MKKAKYLLFSALIIILSAISYTVYTYLQCSKLNCLTFQDSNKYTVKEVYEENKYIYRALYQNQNILIRAEIRPNSSKNEVEDTVKVQKIRIAGLFDDAAAPYPGEISDVISCGNEFKPIHTTITNKDMEINLFSGYVNDRLVFGSCVSDQAKYRNNLAMFYCEKQKKYYQVEVIVPNSNYASNPNKYNQIIQSISCK